MTVLVTGAGGFIGGHLVDRLLETGADVRAVDVKPLGDWYQVHESAENVVGDCSDPVDAHKVADGTDEIYNLAADMGGMGFIENNKAECMLSVLTSTNM
ncbi:MAG: NAD-dependent epimerase/dehydratase family protein, partial [Aeromicrobium sp.]